MSTDSSAQITRLRLGVERRLSLWVTDRDWDEAPPAGLFERPPDWEEQQFDWDEAQPDWNEARLIRAEEAVRKVGAAVGVIDAAEADPLIAEAERYQWLVIEEAIEAELRQLVPVPGGQDWPWFALSANRVAAGEELAPSRMLLRVNVNSCSERLLEGLAGIGKRSARRIVEKREEIGRFASLEEVRQAAGVSRPAFEKAQPSLMIGWPETPAVPAVTREIRRDGFPAFVKAVVERQLDVSWTYADDSRDILIETLEHAASRIAHRAGRPRFWVPSTERLVRAAVSLDQRDLRRAAQREAEPKAGSTTKVAPVPSGAYLPLLESLIAGAKERIWCSMFFFHVDGESSPGGKIVALLKAAQDRGVDVRLILDDDLPGDYHNARAVNEDAFAAVREAGLPMRPFYPDVTAHGKAVAFDAEEVLVGSHNWTSSSFYRYEETSLLVVSGQLNSEVTRQHESWWKLLAEKAAERVVELSSLELLNPWQKAAAAEAKVVTGDDLAAKARLISGRRKLAEPMRLREDEVEKLRDVVVLMKAFRVSETTATALVWSGLDTVAQVRRASRAEIEAALEDLSDLPAPLNVRRIPGGVVDYLWQHE
jgi:competence ComEA-like helix-hairpin-helix protein